MKPRITLQVTPKKHQLELTDLSQYDSVRAFALEQLNALTALALQITGSQAAAVCWISSGGVHLMAQHGFAQEIHATTIPRDRTIFAPKQTVQFQAASTLEAIQQFLGVDGFTSVLALPFCSFEGFLLGSVLVLDDQVKHHDQQQIKSLEAIIDLTMNGIHQARAESLRHKPSGVSQVEVAIEQAKESVIQFDLDYKVQIWNTGAEETYGYQKQEMLGQSLQKILSDPEMQVLRSMVQQLTQGQLVSPREVIRYHESGFRLLVRSSLHAVRDSDGQMIAVLELSGVPSDNHRAAAVERLHELVQCLPVVFWQTDLDGRVTFIDGKLLWQLGLSEHDLIGINVKDFFVGEPVIQALIESGLSGQRLHETVLWQGKFFEYWIEPIMRQTKFVGCHVMALDVSERHHIQDKLAEQQARAELVQGTMEEQLIQEREFAMQICNTMNQGLLTLDDQGLVVFANSMSAQMLGADNTQRLIGQHPIQFVPEAQRPAVQTEWRSIVKGQTVTFRHSIKRFDGETREVEVTVYPKQNTQKRFISAIMTVTDITQVVQLELAAHLARRGLERESRNALLIANATSDGMAYINQDFIFEYVNPAWVKMLGYSSSQDFIGTSCKAGFLEADTQFFAIQDQRLRAGEVCEYQFAAKRADGSTFIALNRSVPRFDQGLYSGFVVIQQNISAAALQQRQQEIATTIATTVNQGLAVIRANGQFEFINPALEKMLKQKAQTLLGVHLEDVVALAELPRLAALRQEPKALGNQTFFTRLRNQEHDFPVEIGVYPQFKDGEFNGAILVITNLAEQIGRELEVMRLSKSLAEQEHEDNLLTQIIEQKSQVKEIKEKELTQRPTNLFLGAAKQQLESKRQTQTTFQNLVILPNFEAALACMRGLGGVSYFQAKLEIPPNATSEKVVLRGRGFVLIVEDADLSQPPEGLNIATLG